MSTRINNLYVLGAMSISQYSMPDKTPKDENKILTIIGESHQEDYEVLKNDCPNPKITVPEYIRKISDGTNLMLEIPPGGFGAREYTSSNLNSIIQQVIDNKIKTTISGIDIRPDFIRPSELYTGNAELGRRNLIDVMSYFYITMPKAIDNLKGMISYELLTTNQIEYLEQFLSQLEEDYRLINTTFLKTVDYMIQVSEKTTVGDYLEHQKTIKGVTNKGEAFSYTMIDIFRVFWSKVTDFMVLNNLYRSDHKHNILLIGYKHADNLDSILFKFRVFPSKYKPLKDSSRVNCSYVSKLLA